MDEYFEIYAFRFVDKKTKSRCEIYARTVETALKIIDMWNSLGVFTWVKPKFRFMKKCFTSIPPYEVEQEQLNTIKEWIQNTID